MTRDEAEKLLARCLEYTGLENPWEPIIAALSAPPRVDVRTVWRKIPYPRPLLADVADALRAAGVEVVE